MASEFGARVGPPFGLRSRCGVGTLFGAGLEENKRKPILWGPVLTLADLMWAKYQGAIFGGGSQKPRCPQPLIPPKWVWQIGNKAFIVSCPQLSLLDWFWLNSLRLHMSKRNMGSTRKE